MIAPRVAATVAFLCILMMPIGQMGIDLYAPSMPSMVHAFSASSSAIQFTVTLFTLGLSLALLVTGPLTDRFGRHRFLLLGTGLYVAMALVAAMTTQLHILYLTRVFQGAGAGMAVTTARAAITDCYDGEILARVMTNMAIVWSFTPVMAPYIGGHIENVIGWYGNFFFMASYGGVILILCLLFIEETLSPTERHPIRLTVLLSNFRKILVHRHFIGTIIVMCMGYGYLILFNVLAPFILQNTFGLNPVQYGEVILLVAMTQLAGNFINKMLLSYVSRSKIIITSVLIALIANLVQLLAAWRDLFGFYWVLMPVTINFFAIGLFYANCLSNVMALFRNVAGSASALLGFLPMLACMLATLVAAHLPQNSIVEFAVISSTGYFFAILMYWWGVFSPEKHQ